MADQYQAAATEALVRLRALWRAEREAARERAREERAGVPLAERVRRGIALSDLAIDEAGAAAGGRTLLWLVTRSTRAPSAGALRIRPGDPVRLWFDDPEGRDAASAIVKERRRERLAVVVSGEVPERLFDEGFRLDKDDPQATFQRGERALAAFIGARPASDAIGHLKEVLFGGRPPELGDPPEGLKWRDEALNGPQREAVEVALAAAPVSLVHGPPGTGKTRTLVEIVAQCVARGERVLASAASNLAVDNLAERLVDAGLEVVRVGHPARVTDAVQDRTLDALIEATEGWQLARRWLAEAHAIRRKIAAKRARGSLGYQEGRALRGEMGRLFRDARAQLRGAEERVLARAQVVCATAAGADQDLLRDLDFDRVVLDEATQAPDPMALVALARAPRAVLAGDPRQLPPTVISQDAARGGLAETVFERLEVADFGALVMLEVQHRMHEAIMAFPSERMYAGRLRAAEDVARHGLSELGVAVDPLRPGPLVFIDTAGKGWAERSDADDPSTSNPEQAARTAREVERLLGRGLAASALGVITPYGAQVRVLRELLAPRLLEGLEIHSVDGFQGREKEAIVVDLVRSNDDGALGFLADTRRMNVAITRARRLLLVIGDSATLGAHPWYAAFLEAVEATGTYLSAWADECPPFPA